MIDSKFEKDKITFVLPLAGDYDLNLTKLFLLPSFQKFFLLHDVNEFIIIVKNNESRIIAETLKPFTDLKLNIVNEETILQYFQESRGVINGWHLQQMLKLWVCKIIKTRIYCLLDSDCYLIRTCGLTDFQVDGKCIFNDVDYKYHRNWWRRARKAMKIEKKQMSKCGFGVTPALLFTNVVMDLLSFAILKDINLVRTIEKGATEYTLYWTYLCGLRNYSDYYAENQISLYGQCIWKGTIKAQKPRGENEIDWLKTYLASTFSDESPFYFSLFQSIIKNYSIETRVKLLQHHFS